MNEIRIGKGVNGGLGLGRRSASRGEHAGRRARSRDSLFLMASITRLADESAREIPARIRNLSEVGLMADFRDYAIVGETVNVEIRGLGLLPGKVAWIEPTRIGITFDEEIDPKKARKPVGGSQAASD
jgi:hypothetical protein